MNTVKGTADDASRPVNAGSVFRSATTHSVPVADRLDYWRSLFRASRIERPRFSSGPAFDAEIVTSNPANDVVFAGLQGDPVACHFGQRDSGMVLLGCVRSGAVGIRQGCNQIAEVRPETGLVLLDCDRPFNTISKRYAMDYLSLPRTLVTTSLADDPGVARRPLRIVPPGVLTGNFQRHMRTMALHGADMTAADAHDAIAVARGLAVAILAGVNANWRSLPEACGDDLFVAARHQLRLHVDDPEFTAEQLAATLGCSRAHLYRLFERRGQTITGQLRELRLQQARRLLETRLGQAVGMTAMQCGYTDLTAFGKAFRRRFGCAPSECRYRAQDKSATV